VSLIYPFGRDQGSYAYAGWVLLEGGMPYRDVFVLKPPMTVFVHGLAMGLFGMNTWAIRVLDLGWSALTAFVVAAVSLELWGRRDAALAAGLTWPFLYYQIDYWNTAQTDGWMTLACAAAIWAVLRGGRALVESERSAFAWWALAGALSGVAVLFKYTAGTMALPILVAFGFVASVQGRRAWLGLVPVFLGSLVPLASFWLWFVGTGTWDAFLDSQVGLLPFYLGRSAKADARQTLEVLTNLKGFRSDLVPLFWAGPAALIPALLGMRRSTWPSWLGLGVALSWWLAAVTSIVTQGKFFDYHYLPLTAPSALLAGLGLAVLLRHPLSWLRRRELQVLALAALAALLIAVTPLGDRVRDLARVTAGSQTIEEYIGSRPEYAFPSYNVAEIRRVSKLLEDTTAPDQRVFVWGCEPTINVRARRHTVSRFLYNFPLRMRWGDPGYEDELMAALRADPPEVFVVASQDRLFRVFGNQKVSAQLLGEFGQLDAFVKAEYEPERRVGSYLMWRLRDSEPPQ